MTTLYFGPVSIITEVLWLIHVIHSCSLVKREFLLFFWPVQSHAC